MADPDDFARNVWSAEEEHIRILMANARTVHGVALLRSVESGLRSGRWSGLPADVEARRWRLMSEVQSTVDRLEDSLSRQDFR